MPAILLLESFTYELRLIRLAVLREVLAKLDQVFIFDIDGLEYALKKAGLWEKYQKGELRCAICHERVTQENFGAFKPGSVEVICNKLSCYYKALSQSGL